MNLLSRLFRRRLPAPVTYSCLVAGVVKSLKEDPSSWSFQRCDQWRHEPTGLLLICQYDHTLGDNTWRPDWVGIQNAPEETAVEQALLREAAFACYAAYWDRVRAQIAVEMAPRIAVFVKLGCGDVGAGVSSS